jgi:hypothetical protein
MPSTGNVFPGTGENNAGIGATAWTNPTNVLSDNAADATCNAGASSQYLVARNFGLAIPAGSTISGITIRVEASEHSPGNEVLRAQLQDHTGALIGTSKTVTLSGTTKLVYTFGGAADSWGATLTDAIVNDADFGVRLWFTTSHDVRIDFVTLAVEYALVTAGGGVFPGPVFPGPVFPEPVFPGTGANPADITVALIGVEAGATGILTGVVFPPEVFPGPVFPSPVFPSEATAGDTGGVGTVLPSTTKTLPSILVNGHVGSVGAAGASVVPISGVEAAVSVGSVVASLDKALTTVAATGAVGTVSVAGQSVALVGVSATAASGTVAPEKTLAISGVAATGSVGLVSVTRLSALTGVAASGALGFIAADPARVDVLSGVQATASVGVVSTSLVGVQAAGEVGSTVADSTVALTGVAATTGAGVVKSTPTSALTSVAVTGSVGSVAPVGVVALSGVSATASVGSVAVPTQVAAITGVSATTAVGSQTPSSDVGLTGVEAAGAVGTVTTTADREQALTGVAALGQLGFVTAQTDVLAILTGVTGTGQVGLVVADRIAALSGETVTGSVGSVAADPNRTTALTGILLTVSVGNVNRASIPLTGVAAAVQVDSVVANFFLALSSTPTVARVGHTPANNDVIVDLEGVVAGVGSVGVLGVGPQMPSDQYRHSVSAPIQKKVARDLVDLERELVLMED